MDRKLLIIMIIWISIGIWEFTVVYTYQTSVNKTSYENDACFCTIIRSIINILNGINTKNIYHFKKNNIYLQTLILNLILINIIAYIINVSLFSILKKYGIFIQVILLEFIMYLIITSFIFLFLLLSYFRFINKTELSFITPTIIHIDNIQLANVNIPQLAVHINYIEPNIIIPQATPINNICNLNE